MAIDFVWLNVVAKNLYRESLKPLLAVDFNKLAAVVFYLIFIFGVLYFAVYPALRDGDLTKAVIAGVIFGFVAYATYDLTNLATLKQWPLKITVIDMVWGAVLSGSVAAIGYGLGRWLGVS